MKGTCKASGIVIDIKIWFNKHLFSPGLRYLLTSMISLCICIGLGQSQLLFNKSPIYKAYSLNYSFSSSSEIVDCKQQMPNQRKQLEMIRRKLKENSQKNLDVVSGPRQLLSFSQSLPLKPIGLSSLLLSSCPLPSPLRASLLYLLRHMAENVPNTSPIACCAISVFKHIPPYEYTLCI